VTNPGVDGGPSGMTGQPRMQPGMNGAGALSNPGSEGNVPPVPH
jgi:hypothetical protein